MYENYNNSVSFKISPMEIRKLALTKVNATAADFTWQKIIYNNGAPVYELEFTANDMAYSMCLDANDGSVLSLTSEPKCA